MKWSVAETRRRDQTYTEPVCQGESSSEMALWHEEERGRGKRCLHNKIAIVEVEFGNHSYLYVQNDFAGIILVWRHRSNRICKYTDDHAGVFEGEHGNGGNCDHVEGSNGHPRGKPV